MRILTKASGRLAALAVIGSAGLAAFAAISPASAQGEVTELDVLLPNERTTTFYAMFVADALGYFEDEGIEVNWLSSATTVPYVAFLSNGDADIVMLDAPQTYQAVDSDQPVMVVYEDMQFAPESIYVPTDSEIDDLAALEGATIGLASDRDRVTVEVALDTVGLTLDDVETVVVGDAGPTLANAIQSGQIDALAAGATEMNTLQAAGIQVDNITPPEVSENPANSFVIWGPRTDELRPAVEGFLRAWTKGEIAAESDREAAAAILKQAIPEQWEDPEVGMNLLNRVMDTLHNPLTEQRSDLQPEVWSRVQAPYIEMGEISQQLDPATFLDDSFIDAANDVDEAEAAADMAEWKAANPDLVEAVQ